MSRIARVRGKRAMLNLPGHESTAAIVAELAEHEYGIEINYQLSDCTRTVSFAFGNPWEDDEDLRNAMYKLDTIVDATRALQRAIRAEYRRRNR